MKLVGDDEVVPIPECETVGLDHPGKVDYASVGEFHAVEEERPMGWGSCYEVCKNNCSNCNLVLYFDLYS